MTEREMLVNAYGTEYRKGWKDAEANKVGLSPDAGFQQARAYRYGQEDYFKQKIRDIKKAEKEALKQRIKESKNR